MALLLASGCVVWWGFWSIELLNGITAKDATRVDRALKCGADPNLVGPQRVTVLCSAVMMPAPEVVDVLLAAGADPNGPSWPGVTPLELAVIRDEISIATLILKRGGDPNLRDAEGKPLRELAYSVGMRKILKEAMVRRTVK